MKTYNVGLIGLGAIASGYSEPQDPAPYTHTGGIFRSQRVCLAAACDLSAQARDAFEGKWREHLPDFQLRDSLETLFNSGDELPILAVCVRGPFHFQVLNNVLDNAHRIGLRSVFLEKPPTCSLSEWDTIRQKASAANVAITVSYSRHWAPHLIEMQRRIADGLIGKVHTVVGYCGQGVLSFASHTTDLLCQFAGSYAPQWVEARVAHPETPPESARDTYEDEPHLQRLTVGFANGVTGVQIGQKGDGDQFYADVFGTQGRARVGMYRAPEAFDMDNKPLELGAMPPNRSVFSVAYEQIADWLDGGNLPDCSNDAAQAVHEIGFGAIESGAQNGARVPLPNPKRDRLVWANG